MRRPFALTAEARVLGRALLLLGAIAASHQVAAQPPPSRIANIWDYRDHQPTRGSVRSAEQAGGIALSTPEKSQVDDELQRLYEQLLAHERSSAVEQVER
jgi:hypothetical protein